MSGVFLARPRERADIVTVCEGKAPVLGRNGVVTTLHRDQLKNPNGGKGVNKHHFTINFVHLRFTFLPVTFYFIFPLGFFLRAKKSTFERRPSFEGVSRLGGRHNKYTKTNTNTKTSITITKLII